MYSVNPMIRSGFFMLPSEIADKFIKLASHTELTVIIWVFRNAVGEIDVNRCEKELGYDNAAVVDALDFWAEQGILIKQGKTLPEPAKQAKKSVRAAVVKPTRLEVATRGNECPEIAFLLGEAQKKFGRALKESEASTIVWLYDDEGISLSLMMLLFENVSASGSFRIGAIERTAVEWVEAGITNVKEAESYLIEKKARNDAWLTVSRAMGIPGRKPSDNEAKLAYTWVEEWGISFELLKHAYNICIDTTSKFSMPYIKKIIEKWHSEDITTPEQAAAASNKQPAFRSNTTYDRELAKNMMFTDEDL